MGDHASTASALRETLSAFTDLPVYYENSDTDPTLAAAPQGFVYCEVHGIDGRQISLGLSGNRHVRDRGEFVIWVNIPRGDRASRAEMYAEQIRALFQPSTIAGVEIDTRTIGRGRESGAVNGPSGRIWSVPVIIDWYADRLE